MSTEIHGIIAYPVTPFTADGTAIDTAGLAGLVDTLVHSGVHAVAPLGSTGEAAYLSEDEFDTVVDVTVEAVGRRVPVVVGAGDLTTANTIRRARKAERAGADERERMAAAFIRSAQYEWLFWDSAYRMEAWPVGS